MESVINNTEEIESREAFNQKLAVAITSAIEMETAFKLYSYRIISPEVYMDRINQIIKNYESCL